MDTVRASQANPEPQCPQCGTPLPAGALGGLCPACLLRQGVESETGAEGRQPAFNPPSLAELGPLFPRLELLEFIGKGGMGAVYKARQKHLDRIVALKILPPGIGDDTAFAERFTREAKALARLNHPGIVTLYEFGQVASGTATGPQPLYFFLMEFVDGVNLRQLLAHGRVSPREALAIVPQICDALQCAHDQGIVHRDIKPENILVDRRGRVKVADFGLAKIVQSDGFARALAIASTSAGASAGGSTLGTGLTQPGGVMGTPQYMSPEQIQSPGGVDHRADIYALGVVFYQMLTGQLPGQPLEPPSRKVLLDVRLDEVVLRALENTPELRYQQASALKTQIETIASTPGAGLWSPAASARYQGVDYRSQGTLFGLPWVHVATGFDPASGKLRLARGIIAIGNRAEGLVAIGGIAKGGLAIGGLAMGLLAFGGLGIGVIAFGGGAVGLLAIGGAALALVAAMGGGAAAPIALGGGAVGYFAFAAGAIGVHVWSVVTKDPVAGQFFLPWAGNLIAHFQLINALLLTIILGVGVGVGLGVPLWLQRRVGVTGSDRRQGGPPSACSEELPQPGAAPKPAGLLAQCISLTYAGALVFGAVCELLRGRAPGQWLVAAFIILACLTPILVLLVRGAVPPETWRSGLRLGAFLAAFSALPTIGFAAFFVSALIQQGLKWNPALDEAILVPLTWLGAVLLPICTWRLWRAGNHPTSKPSATL